MRISNYPAGFNSGVLLREFLADRPAPRRNLYVGNNSTLLTGEKGASDSTSNGTFLRPWATVDYAIGQAKSGDRIWVRPGHAITIIADSGVDADVAGIEIIGLGRGEYRPIVTFTTAAAADFKIAAANILLANFIFKCNIANQDMMIEITGDDAEIAYCEFREGSATGLNFITIGVADGDADRCYIHDNRFYAPTAGNYNSAIAIVKDMTDSRIINNVIYGDFDDAGILVPTAGNACVNLQIEGNRVTNLQDSSTAYGIYVAGSAVTGSADGNIIQTVHPNSDFIHSLMQDKGNLPEWSICQDWYADSVNGSDSNDGRSWKTAKVTLMAAINEAQRLPGTTDIDDTKDHNAVVHVAPGHYNEAIAFSGYNIKVVGESPYRGKDYGASINYDGATAANAAIAFSGSGIELCNLHISCATAIPAVWCSAGDNNYIHDCHIECDGTNATYGIEMDSMKGSKIERVVISNAKTAGIWVKGGADHYFINGSIEGCQIYSAVTGAKGILVDVTNVVYNSKIHQNHIDLEPGGATSIGIDNNATGNLFITENYIVVETAATAAESASHGMLRNQASVNGTVTTALDDD